MAARILPRAARRTGSQANSINAHNGAQASAGEQDRLKPVLHIQN